MIIKTKKENEKFITTISEKNKNVGELLLEIVSVVESLNTYMSYNLDIDEKNTLKIIAQAIMCNIERKENE